MKKSGTFGRQSNQRGYTFPEIAIALAIIAIAVAVGTSATLAWQPSRKLNSAAKDLNSTLQMARMLAVKRGTQMYVVFDNTVAPGSYFTTANDPSITTEAASQKLNSTYLASYGYNVDFTFPAGGFINWNNTPVVNSISASFPNSLDGFPYCTFNTDGTLAGINGTIYLAHNGTEHIVYAVALLTTGYSKVRKYNGITPFNSANWLE